MVDEDSTLKDYMAMPLDAGIFKVIKVKYVFYLFYIGLAGLWLWLLRPDYIVVVQSIILIAFIIAAEVSFRKIYPKKV